LLDRQRTVRILPKGQDAARVAVSLAKTTVEDFVVIGLAFIGTHVCGATTHAIDPTPR